MPLKFAIRGGRKTIIGQLPKPQIATHTRFDHSSAGEKCGRYAEDCYEVRRMMGEHVGSPNPRKSRPPTLAFEKTRCRSVISSSSKL